MKRFIVSVLCVAVFFIGLGGLVEKAAAGLRSDDRALAIIKQARAAIGGETNIANVRALTITAKATQNFSSGGAVARSEQGDLEINMQLPNQFSKTMKFGDGVKGDVEVRKEVKVFARTIDGDAAMLEKEASADGKRDVIIMRKGEGEPLVVNTDEPGADGRHKIIIRKGDGTTQESATGADKNIIVDKIKVAHGAMRHNELFRTAFALLLTVPEGSDASYTFAGEADVDGSTCNVIAITQNGGESFKLYLDKSTSLPRMMSYQAVKPLVFKFNKEDAQTGGEKAEQVYVRRAAGEALEKAEYQVKFSDFRSVGGLQLPFNWTQTVAGQADQTIDVVNYDINPAGIAEKFSQDRQKVQVRTMKQK